VNEFESADGKLERALDRALGRTCQPPQVPKDFRRRFAAALARAAEPDLAALRSRLESEQQAQLTRLASRYVRLTHRTLGTLIGAAFATGAAATLALPWMERHLGADGPRVLTAVGGAVGLAIAFLSWRAHVRSDAL
jgi:hypothetical protein